MTRFFTADLHLGHRNIIEYSGWRDAIDLEVAGECVLACHFPYRGDSYDHDRYLAHRLADKGAWLLHGHVHKR